MLYLVALIVPPLAVLLCGKPFQAVVNLGIAIVSFVLLVVGVGLLGIPVCVIHALFVVHNFYADQRNERLMKTLRATADPQATESEQERQAEELWARQHGYYRERP